MKTFRNCGILIFAMLLIIAGCSNEKTLLRLQVAAQADSLAQVRNRLQTETDSLQNTTLELGRTRVELDSIFRQTQSLDQNIRQLNSRVSRLRKENEDLQSSLDKSLTLRDSITSYYSGVIKDTLNALTGLRTEISSTHLTLSQRDSLIDQIRPWYAKWKHDATTRSFIEVLFASGKAKKPDIPEPSF